MRLLLAEDEEDLSRALVTVLKHNNYSVDAVYDGAEALDYLENGWYHRIKNNPQTWKFRSGPAAHSKGRD